MLAVVAGCYCCRVGSPYGWQDIAAKSTMLDVPSGTRFRPVSRRRKCLGQSSKSRQDRSGRSGTAWELWRLARRPEVPRERTAEKGPCRDCFWHRVARLASEEAAQGAAIGSSVAPCEAKHVNLVWVGSRPSWTWPIKAVLPEFSTSSGAVQGVESEWLSLSP